jgi:hypothetical protein
MSFLLENFQMKSITAMELQETSFPDLGSKIANCNLVRLQLLNGSSREFTNPQLGRDFLAGTLEDGKSLGVFRRSILRSVEFAFEPELASQSLQYTRRAIGELLASQQFPSLAKVGYLETEAPVQKIRLIGVARGFLFTDYYLNPAIPIAALGQIELDCA